MRLASGSRDERGAHHRLFCVMRVYSAMKRMTTRREASDWCMVRAVEIGGRSGIVAQSEEIAWLAVYQIGVQAAGLGSSKFSLPT